MLKECMSHFLFTSKKCKLRIFLEIPNWIFLVYFCFFLLYKFVFLKENM